MQFLVPKRGILLPWPDSPRVHATRVGAEEGSCRALERLPSPDQHGSVVDAARSSEIDTAGSIVRCEDPEHVVTLGGENLIGIATPQATLIADQTNEELIRLVRKPLGEKGWESYL